MPSQKNRLLTLLAVGMILSLMLFALAACGGTQATPAPAEPTAEPAAEEAEPSRCEEPGC